MSLKAWPKPPIRPEDLSLICELLTEEEFAELLRRLVQVLPNCPLLDYRQGLHAPSRSSDVPGGKVEHKTGTDQVGA